MAKDLVKKMDALRMGKEMGCSGAHKDPDGNWLPCSSPEELERLSNIAETSKWRTVVSQEKPERKSVGRRRKRKRNKDWENLGEKPIQGIVSLDGGGLVSGNLFAGKAANIGPEYVRETDRDVFMDPESARSRARQLGCVGISRRISKNGRAVWMPCTNMSDYANRTGSTALGRRNMEGRRMREMREAVREVLRSERGSRKVSRKTSIIEEIEENK